MKWCHVCDADFDGDLCRNCGWGPQFEGDLKLYAPGSARAGHGYNPAHYEEMSRLETGHFWFRARNRLITHAVRKYFPDARSFLEIGCGTGMVLQAVRGAHPNLVISGSELFVEGLAFARTRLPDVDLMQMDATRIPFAGEFDVIGAFDVLEHIDDDVTVMREIHRALAPRGGALFTVPQHPWLWSQQDEMACHVRRYRRGELEGKLRNCGFRIVHSTSFVSLLLPLLAISRRSMKGSEDPFHEMRIGSFTNAVLGGAMKLEFQLSRTGLPLPAGGSRLVAAIRE